jgi:hypothetical protein
MEKVSDEYLKEMINFHEKWLPDGKDTTTLDEKQHYRLCCEVRELRAKIAELEADKNSQFLAEQLNTQKQILEVLIFIKDMINERIPNPL